MLSCSLKSVVWMCVECMNYIRPHYMDKNIFNKSK